MASQVPLCSVTMLDGHTDHSRETIPVLTVDVPCGATEPHLGFSKSTTSRAQIRQEPFRGERGFPKGKDSSFPHLHSIEAGPGQSSERSPRSVM